MGQPRLASELSFGVRIILLARRVARLHRLAPWPEQSPTRTHSFSRLCKLLEGSSTSPSAIISRCVDMVEAK
jgi:hypothetical protein